MLKLKKLFLAMMVAAIAVTGFVSCSNDDDDEDTPDSDTKQTTTQTYTVSYSSTQGTAPSAITVDENTVLTSDQLPTLSATGYTFNGWYDGTTKAEAGTYKVIGNVTLTASWTLDAPAPNVVGTFYVNETASVASTGVTASATTVKIVQSKDSDGNEENAKVDITLPGISYSAAMTIASFTIEDVVVSSDDSENYTFSLGTFTSSVTVNNETKTITGTSVRGTYVKSTGKINLTAVYTYGSMPMALTDSFTNEWADSYDSEYKFSDLSGYGYKFDTKSGAHTFTVISDTEIVYYMTVTSMSKTFSHYLTYTAQEVGKNVYLVAGYMHDDTPTTAADTSTATPSYYRVEISSPTTSIKLLSSQTEATLVSNKISTIYGNSYSFAAGTTTHTLTINETDNAVTYAMGSYVTYTGTWTSTTVSDESVANCTDFVFTFPTSSNTSLQSDLTMNWRIRVINEDYIQLINTTRGTTTLATKSSTESE